MDQVSVESILEALGKPLPKEGVQKMTMPDGRELIGYKPQYYIDRLNEVFPFDWSFDIVKGPDGKYMIIENDGCVGMFCELVLYSHDEKGNRSFMTSAKQWGGMVIDGNITWPDAYKGAMSNALGKCCSLFGIGGEAYRGQIDAALGQVKKNDPLAMLKTEIQKIAAEKGIKSKAFQTIAKTVLDKVQKVEVNDLDEADLKKILKAIENHIAE